MKNTLKILLFVFAISLFSCSTTDEEANESLNSSNLTISETERANEENNNFEQNLDLTESNLNNKNSDEEIKAYMYETFLNKYEIEIEFIGERDYIFNFPDGRSLHTNTIENGVVFNGSLVNNSPFFIRHLTKREIDELSRTNNPYLLSSNLLKKEFIVSINDPDNIDFALQTFNECFKEKWDDFCDGLLGCLVQATHPIHVAVAISAVCVYETS